MYKFGISLAWGHIYKTCRFLHPRPTPALITYPAMKTLRVIAHGIYQPEQRSGKEHPFSPE